MADLDWFPVEPGRYLKNTLHLTTRQHGAYWLLIFAAFECKGRLPGTDAGLASIAKLTSREWKDDGDVLKAFLTRDGDGWVHEFVTHARADAEARVAAKSRAGKAGAEKRWRGRGNGTAMAEPSNSHRQTDAHLHLNLQEQSFHGTTTETVAASASASPDGPPRSPLPDSAKWAARLDSFSPWLPYGDPKRGKWQATWGLSPDSAGTNPSIPGELLKAWRAKRDAAMKMTA